MRAWVQTLQRLKHSVVVLSPGLCSLALPCSEYLTKAATETLPSDGRKFCLGILLLWLSMGLR